MRMFGLIGYPLSHSFSEKFFSDKFLEEGIRDVEYKLFPIEDISKLSDLVFLNKSLCGLNVTIPYKQAVFPFLDFVHETAKEIGAVNCIAIHRLDSKAYLRGYNTDAYGFEQSLIPLLKPRHTRALIFGNGGAAKAVMYVLGKLKIDYAVVSRQAGFMNYEDVDSSTLASHTLLINTTPLGMHPNIELAPEIPYEFISKNHLAYDLIYNPDKTQFLKNAEKKGAAIKNGLEMLHLQADKSWYIWNRE